MKRSRKSVHVLSAVSRLCHFVQYLADSTVVNTLSYPDQTSRELVMSSSPIFAKYRPSSSCRNRFSIELGGVH